MNKDREIEQLNSRLEDLQQSFDTVNDRLIEALDALDNIYRIAKQFSRVASFLSFFRDLGPPHMVGYPSFRESVKLV